MSRRPLSIVRSSGCSGHLPPCGGNVANTPRQPPEPDRRDRGADRQRPLNSRAVAETSWCRAIIDITALGCLHRRAGHGAVRAKHAAVVGLRLQDARAVRAVEEVLAGIRRHRLLRLVPAVRAGDHRVHLDQNPIPPIGRTRLFGHRSRSVRREHPAPPPISPAPARSEPAVLPNPAASPIRAPSAAVRRRARHSWPAGLPGPPRASRACPDGRA